VIKENIDKITNNYDGLEKVIWDEKTAIPLVKEKLNQVQEHKDKVYYAHILGIYGLDDGWEVLMKAVQDYNYWDDGWNYTGMGQFGMSFSYLDSLILALGRTKKKEALPAIREKVSLLTFNSEFSHIRAVSLALGYIGGAEAAKLLHDILLMPGMSGYATTSMKESAFTFRGSRTDTSIRNLCLKELFLARGLYLAGDHNGLGKKILKEYAADLRGHYSKHARGILKMQNA
jgi:hypothetical protein